MARKAKTPKFEQFTKLDNCFDLKKGEDWRKYWDKEGAVTVELGCGKAELLLELARRHPDQHFIGIDIKSDRMYKPAQTAKAEKLANIIFLRAHAKMLSEIFKNGEVNELWITFPDPYPKKRAAKHRLLHPDFLVVYRQVLADGANIHFKTDNKRLYEWGFEQIARSGLFSVVKQSCNLHTDGNIGDEPKLITAYERRFVGQSKPIFYAEIQKI